MKNLTLLVFLLGTIVGWSQDGGAYTYQTFKDTRIVNGHSVETNDAGELKFIIQHRFGLLSGGAYELFGLDQSNVRIAFDYGLTNNMSIGIARSSFEKTYDGFVKYKLLAQREGGMPFTVTAYASMACKGLKWEDPERKNYFTSRLYYGYQLLIARKFHDRFSAQLMPTLVHRNLIPDPSVKHDVMAMGAATRMQLTKMLSVQLEYFYVLPNQLAADRTNSLSIGVDIETKGHVFQLHVSNSRGMTERFYILDTTGDVAKGDFHIGFNISRDFRITRRK
ncbi:MAG: hypothetical protein KDC12_03355 [Flavobacteriales bacterium]|nr:hypothetical protein [Flavobacteriales bacterium]